ncbi:hypothetical protein CALCODRAFT_317884 [Calocera cornea HHB12733]|uniref:Rab-GAP TBC domain-containing protein n=1 Tax=Calocera cornea HHB12733 TaxID=1353952 RepID=A0A165F9C2_9BASI|nr:hypothetical protein CALCODRAFT_317884 [Calocera cornea HHB12733]
MDEGDVQPELWDRPLPHEILLAFNNVFRNDLSVSSLRETVISGRLGQFCNSKQGNTLSSLFTGDRRVGRSLLWKFFLLPGSPLVDGDTVRVSFCLSELRTAREAYSKLSTKRLRAPDGTPFPHSRTQSRSSGPRQAENPVDSGGWEKNNPLSLDAENPWQQWFADLELRKVIRQDVERIFPEVSYFTSTDIQENLTDILFLYCLTHPLIGYRQGMHELAGAVLMVVDIDSLSGNNVSDSEALEFCTRDHVSADVYAIFRVLMEGAGRWYEWREPRQQSASRSGEGWVAPIVNICRHMQGQILRSVDPALWARLDSAGIEPQMYGIRWLRLLFTREFDLPDAMAIWDSLIAADASLQLAEWICVAMLLRIRNQLLATDDYSMLLTYLLRYPSLNPTVPSLLVKQALFLRETALPTSGVTVMLQNRDVLGVPIEASPRDPPKQVPTRHREMAPRTDGHYERVAPGLTELIAKSLMDRADTVALNRAFLSTVAELRKGLPDLTSNISRSFTTQPVPLWSSITSTTEGPSPSQQDRLSRLYSEQERLGSAMAWTLSVLNDTEATRESREHALRTMEHVRDVLLRKVDFNASRLEPIQPKTRVAQLPAILAGSQDAVKDGGLGDNLGVTECSHDTVTHKPSTITGSLPRVPYPARQTVPRNHIGPLQPAIPVSHPNSPRTTQASHIPKMQPTGYSVSLAREGATAAIATPAGERSESLDPLGALRR